MLRDYSALAVLSPFLLATATQCLTAQTLRRAHCYTVTSTAPVELSLPAGQTPGAHYVRYGEGDWQKLPETSRMGSTVGIRLTPARGTETGMATVVIDKPGWLSLDDDAPPQATIQTETGKDLPLEAADGVADLGTIPAGAFAVDFRFADAANPLNPASFSWRLVDPRGVPKDLRAAPSLDGRTGRLKVQIPPLPPGQYNVTVGVSDLSPAGHRATAGVRFRVPGATISDDGQRVTLVNTAGEFHLQPHLSKQLRLPEGTWAKLTTQTAKTWLYPRQFVDGRVSRRGHGGTTVLVKAKTQGIKGRPNDGIGELEYELTIRPDTPALLVTTRSRNISAEPTESNANWGWLASPYYVTPEGRQQWRGRARNAYVDVGKVGWLWLAPSSPGKPGLLWASPHTFGESRFDTMLLYSDTSVCQPGETVDIRYAIAPAASPEEAERVYRDLERLGLLTQEERD